MDPKLAKELERKSAYSKPERPSGKDADNKTRILDRKDNALRCPICGVFPGQYHDLLCKLRKEE